MSSVSIQNWISVETNDKYIIIPTEPSSVGAVNQSVATAECTGIDTGDDEVEEKGLLVTTSPTIREEDKENP